MLGFEKVTVSKPVGYALIAVAMTNPIAMASLVLFYILASIGAKDENQKNSKQQENKEVIRVYAPDYNKGGIFRTYTADDLEHLNYGKYADEDERIRIAREKLRGGSGLFSVYAEDNYLTEAIVTACIIDKINEDKKQAVEEFNSERDINSIKEGSERVIKQERHLLSFKKLRSSLMNTNGVMWFKNLKVTFHDIDVEKYSANGKMDDKYMTQYVRFYMYDPQTKSIVVANDYVTALCKQFKTNNRSSELIDSIKFVDNELNDCVGTISKLVGFDVTLRHINSLNEIKL